MVPKASRNTIADDPEYQALRRLAQTMAAGTPNKPLEALEQVAALAREMTHARYAALVVTGDNDEVEGFVVCGLSPEEERRLKAAPGGHGPLGTMRQDGLAVRIDDLSEHARSFGFPPKHPEMKTLLGVPLWVQASLRGALYATDRNQGEPFRHHDEVILQVLARHASAIIAARWY